MNHILQAVTDARRPNFTVAELRKAGPMFNPMHPLCQERKAAWRANKLAQELMVTFNRMLTAKVHAQMDVRDASARLDATRKALNSAATLRGFELAVLDAHDRLWTAQRMLQLFEFTYGPTGEIN